jgi:beta-lactamase regulating signal transducer with metallopeptidase domain
MDAALRFLLTNAALAGALALLAAAADRHVRRPVVVHGLWTVALLRLLAPPLVAVDVPGLDGLWPGALEDREIVLASAQTVERVAAPPIGPEPDPAALGAHAAAGVALITGTLGVACLGMARGLRFRRLLRRARPAPEPLLARTAELSGRLGLRHAPGVRVVPARIPPMLWPALGGPLLVLPAGLLEELGPDERDALLAHELAHLRRRDHWVRAPELLATLLFWWYPVTWWVRRRLRQAEERCCDEWVLRVLPGSAGAYAHGLLKALTFVAPGPDALPAAASGAGPVRDLESRLKEILMTRPAPHLGRPGRLALAAAAFVGLALVPGAAGPRTAPRRPRPLPPPRPAAKSRPRWRACRPCGRP